MIRNVVQCDNCMMQQDLPEAGKGLPEGWVLVAVSKTRVHFCGPKCMGQGAAELEVRIMHEKSTLTEAFNKLADKVRNLFNG